MDWTPITYKKPRILGRHPTKLSHFHIIIRLDRDPTEEWIRAFRNPPGLGRKVPLHEPMILGSEIEYHCAPGEEELWSKDVIERIEAANRNHLETVVPRLQREENESQLRQRREMQEREEAQKRLDQAFGAGEDADDSSKA